MARCYIHSDVDVPPETLETHHKHPQAYGGSNESSNLVDLCATCHGIIHKVALKIYAGNAGEGKHLNERYLPGQPARQERLWKLAQTIARARQQHARTTDIPEAGVDADHESVVKMMLELPDWLHHRYKTLSTGQGLNRYIMKVLENHALVAIQKPGAPKEELYGGPREDKSTGRDPQPISLDALVSR